MQGRVSVKGTWPPSAGRAGCKVPEPFLHSTSTRLHREVQGEGGTGEATEESALKLPRQQSLARTGTSRVPVPCRQLRACSRPASRGRHSQTPQQWTGTGNSSPSCHQNLSGLRPGPALRHIVWHLSLPVPVPAPDPSTSNGTESLWLRP